MSQTVRQYDPPSDYPMICSWWEAHGHPVLPAHLLSPIGFIGRRDGIDLCAVFVYFERHVPICFVERAVSSPKLTVEDASSALLAALSEAKEFSRNLGMQLMCMRVPAAIARYAAREDFIVDERGILNMSCVLQEEEVQCLGSHQ